MYDLGIRIKDKFVLIGFPNHPYDTLPFSIFIYDDDPTQDIGQYKSIMRDDLPDIRIVLEI